MFRAAVVLLLVAAGSASAQPTTPPPAKTAPALPPLAVPGQPPGFVQPAFPNQPPPVVFMPNGGRAAAPTGPRLVVAKVVDGALVYSTSENVPVNKQIDVTVVENGEAVTRKVAVSTTQPATKQASLPLDGLKFKDAGGRKLQPLNVEIRLGAGAGVVLHNGPIADELRAMFKDDVVFVELPANGQPGLPPGFAPQPGFQPQFIQPLGVPGAAPVVVPPAAVPQPAPQRTAPAPAP